MRAKSFQDNLSQNNPLKSNLINTLIDFEKEEESNFLHLKK